MENMTAGVGFPDVLFQDAHEHARQGDNPWRGRREEVNVDGAGASVMKLVGLPLQLLHYLELLHLVEEELVGEQFSHEVRRG